MRTVYMRFMTMLVLAISAVPAIAYAQTTPEGDPMDWRLGIPAAFVAGAAWVWRRIKKTLDAGGSYRFVLEHKEAAEIRKERDEARKELVAVEASADQGAELRKLAAELAELQEKQASADEEHAKELELERSKAESLAADLLVMQDTINRERRQNLDSFARLVAIDPARSDDDDSPTG
jgi:DNA-binding Lrp family transcriptional regulator